MEFDDLFPILYLIYLEFNKSRLCQSGERTWNDIKLYTVRSNLYINTRSFKLQ